MENHMTATTAILLAAICIGFNVMVLLIAVLVPESIWVVMWVGGVLAIQYCFFLSMLTGK